MMSKEDLGRPMVGNPSRFESPEEQEAWRQRMAEVEGSNAMWAWIAGAVVLALVLVFIFARGSH